MSRSKSIFPGHINLLSSQVDFTKEQKTILSNICNKPGFIERIQSIAENYLEKTTLLNSTAWTTEAENLATLKDLITSAQEMSKKLRKMPDCVEALLYKVDDSITTAKNSLQILITEAVIVAHGMPPPKTGRTTKMAELSATKELRQVFQDYNISWQSYLNSYEGNIPPAITVLEMLFVDIGRKAIEHEGIAEYIKKINQSKTGKK